MTTEERMTFGAVADRVLISTVGLIFVYLGVQIRELTSKVQQLCETNAAFTVSLQAQQSDMARIRADLDQHLVEYRAQLTKQAGTQ